MRLSARPARPLRGAARPPGDKSISHRALLFGALAAGTTRIKGLLESADVLATAAAVQALGAEVRREGAEWLVTGAPAWRDPAQPLDFGNSGTGARLTLGALAGRPVRAVCVGDRSLSGRPMGRVIAPLRAMGAQIIARDDRLLPLAIVGAAAPHPLRHESPIASAQVKSAVLLAGLGAEGVTAVIEPAPSRDHTERMLGAFGVAVESGPTPDGRWRAALRGPARLHGCAVAVPGDPSSAAFAAAAAAIVPGSEVVLEAVLLNPLRFGFFEAMHAMGADVQVEPQAGGAEPVGTLRIGGGPTLGGCAPDPASVASFIDEVPILSVLAAFAQGETRITGAADLRHKESDRIALTVAGLRACGVDAEELPDGLVVSGRGPGGVRGGAEIRTLGDHRIAMSFLVLGMGARDAVVVDEAEMIATSFPDFAGFMGALGAEIEVVD